MGDWCKGIIKGITGNRTKCVFFFFFQKEALGFFFLS